MPMFTKDDYDKLHSLVFRDDYPGYKPTVVEIPNGDGKADAEKRYAHVAPKYFASCWQEAALMPYLERAHDLALHAAAAMDISTRYLPDIRYGALRVLDYPPGAVSNEHEDFDLFTLMVYRDQPNCFQAHDQWDPPKPVEVLRRYNRQAHLGQLGQAIGLGQATRHSVLASDSPQHSIVYFAIPNHDAILPAQSLADPGTEVRAWLNERMARSRTEFKKYE